MGDALVQWHAAADLLAHAVPGSPVWRMALTIIETHRALVRLVGASLAELALTGDEPEHVADAVHEALGDAVHEALDLKHALGGDPA